MDDKDKDKAILKMLKENGFPALGLKRQAGLLLASIDPKVNLSEFYMWDEIDPVTAQEDVWRIFTIPAALWTCPVFREHFWKSACLTPVLTPVLSGALEGLTTMPVAIAARRSPISTDCWPRIRNSKSFTATCPCWGKTVWRRRA